MPQPAVNRNRSKIEAWYQHDEPGGVWSTNFNDKYVKHLKINGKIPAELDKYAPNLTHLWIIDISSEDQPKLEDLIMDLKKLQRMIVSDSVALRIAPANLSMNEVRRYIQGKRNQIHNVDAWLWYDGQSPGPPGDGWYRNECRNMKIEVFRTKAEGNKITHLKLSGQMPPDLHNLVPSLTHLSIDCLTPNEHPKLESIGQLKRLKELRLRDNRMTHLPVSLCDLTDCLMVLDLQSNRLHELPEHISNFRRLRVLELDHNELQTLPESIGDLTNLQKLSLMDNQLTELPEIFGEICSLKNLNLSDNHLTVLPNSIEALLKLEGLNIGGNHFTTLPESIGLLTKLKVLEVHNNKLHQLTEKVSCLVNIEQLNLDSNNLKELPDSMFQELQKLQTLKVDRLAKFKTAPEHIFEQGPTAVRKYINAKRKQIHNIDLWYDDGISSDSPDDKWHMHFCEDMECGNMMCENMKNGNIRQSDLICENMKIDDFRAIAEKHHITHLMLSGQIPPDLQILVPHLTHLGIDCLRLDEHPKLESIGRLTKLKELRLRDDDLGYLPISICNLANTLLVLDLKRNKIDELPERIGDLNKLKWLNLESNAITQLPNSIGRLIELQVLNVDDNRLKTLPDRIGCLVNLKRLNLIDNRITWLPESIRMLTKLERIDIIGNPLKNLPERFMQTKLTESLTPPCSEGDVTESSYNSPSEDSSSWELLSSDSDVLSIPEEQEKSLRSLHDRIRQILLDFKDQSESRYATCTIATILGAGSVDPTSLLLVTEGYRTSIPAYTSNRGGNILKISTIHLKTKKLLEMINPTDQQTCGTFTTAAFNVDQSVSRLDEITRKFLQSNNQGKGYLMYSLDSDEYQLSAEVTENQISITFSISSKTDNSIDQVQGSYTLEELSAPNSKSSLLSESGFRVAHLDRPDDDGYTVTCVVMTVKDSSGSHLTLHQLVAGDLDENPFKKEKDWELATVRIRNRRLYQLIKKKFDEQVLSTLTVEMKEKWIKESPLFVVMSDLSSVLCPDSCVIDAIPPSSHRHANGRMFYMFNHPESKDIYYKVFEPASPSKTVASSGKKKGKCEFKMKRMNTGTQIELMKEQKRVIHGMRVHHMDIGDPKDAITLIVSTNRYKSLPVQTEIILVDGIIHRQNILVGNEECGWIMSLSWMYSHWIKEKLRHAWQKRMSHKDNVQAWPALATIKNPHRLDSLQLVGPSKCRKNGGCVEVLLETEGMEIQIREDRNYTITNRRMSWKDELAAFSFDDQIAYTEFLSSKTSPFPELKHRAEEVVKAEICGGSSQENSCAQSAHVGSFDKVTITAVEARFPKSVGCPMMEIAKDTFYVFSLADDGHVHTPTDFLYHDVLYMLACTTWTVDNTALAQAIETYWSNQQSHEEQNKAKYRVYHDERSYVTDGCVTKFDKGFVRFPGDPAHKIDNPPHQKDGVTVEIYSHEHNERAFVKHLKSSSEFQEWRRQHPEPKEEDVRKVYDQFFGLNAAPVSFTYPTLHIALMPFKGIPNRVPSKETRADSPRGASATSTSTNNCLFLSDDNEAHIKFMRPGARPNIIEAANVIVKLQELFR